MDNFLKITDAFKIFPYYPEILMIPLYDDLTDKYSVMIVERLKGNHEGKTLFALQQATYDNEEQIIFATTRALKSAMNAVRVMCN